MIIKVLGKGCKNCDNLADAARKAAAELNLDATVEKVTDLDIIVEYGVMRTPALVVDDKLVLQGKLPSVDALKKLLA